MGILFGSSVNSLPESDSYTLNNRVCSAPDPDLDRSPETTQSPIARDREQQIAAATAAVRVLYANEPQFLIKGETNKPEQGSSVGLKYDQGKAQWVLLRLDLLPIDALMWVSRVLVFGARKYKAHSWRTVPNARDRYMSALFRHWVAIQGGEILDAESGLPHAAHLACDALFFCALECAQKSLDAFAE